MVTPGHTYLRVRRERTCRASNTVGKPRADDRTPSTSSSPSWSATPNAARRSNSACRARKDTIFSSSSFAAVARASISLDLDVPPRASMRESVAAADRGLRLVRMSCSPQYMPGSDLWQAATSSCSSSQSASVSLLPVGNTQQGAERPRTHGGAMKRTCGCG